MDRTTRAILKQAQEMGVPGWATPLWRKKYGREKGPVGSEELATAILALIVDRFGDRTLDWETVERATSLVNFEVKQAAVFA
jgi:hypothetical protein